MRRTLVLNSRSQYNPFFSFLAIHVSPSSRTIFPNKIPRAYILGIVMTYSAGGGGGGGKGGGGGREGGGRGIYSFRDYRYLKKSRRECTAIFWFTE